MEKWNVKMLNWYISLSPYILNIFQGFTDELVQEYFLEMFL